MGEPVKLGEAMGPLPELKRIPKHCPECGLDYEGNSFIGLRPGETRAIYPCDGCFQKREEAARARLQQQNPPQTEPEELRRPERVRKDWDG